MKFTEFVSKIVEDSHLTLPLHIKEDKDPSIIRENTCNVAMSVAEFKASLGDGYSNWAIPIRKILIPLAMLITTWMASGSLLLGIVMVILMNMLSAAPLVFTSAKQIITQLLERYKDVEKFPDEVITLNVVLSGSIKSFAYVFPIAYSVFCFLLWYMAR